MAVKILIADDDALVRESLNIFFEMDDRFEVSGIAHNGIEAYALCKEHEIDVALLDIRMPNMNGVEATAKIVSDTATRVLLLTTFDEDKYIKEAFRNGASGYLLKNSSPEEIKNAVLSVGGGNVVVQDVIMEQFAFADSKKKDEKKLEGLTKREVEVVRLVAGGLTNNEIAKKLFITEGTVKNTVSNILSKLELKHRTQIAIYYLKD
ncbi:MAG: response regulator transcription factor [Clostridia bacterium]|nr:response regulator transcription factor [Clostridia bacterium]